MQGLPPLPAAGLISSSHQKRCAGFTAGHGAPRDQRSEQKSSSFPYYSTFRVASACSSALSADPQCFPCCTPRILTSCTLQSCRSSGDTAAGFTNLSSSKGDVVVVSPCQTPRSEQSKMHLLGSGASKRIPPPAPSSTQSPSGIRNYLKKAPEIILPPCKCSSSCQASQLSSFLSTWERIKKNPHQFTRQKRAGGLFLSAILGVLLPGVRILGKDELGVLRYQFCLRKGSSESRFHPAGNRLRVPNRFKATSRARLPLLPSHLQAESNGAWMKGPKRPF